MPKNTITLIICAVSSVIFIIFLLSINPFYVVQPGERVIVFNSLHGLNNRVKGEGVHFKMPFFDKLIRFDIRQQAYDIDTQAASKDLQNVHVVLRVILRPEEVKLPEIYKNLGLNYADKVMKSITLEAVKAVTATKPAEEIITQREEVSHRIKDGIVQRANDFNLIVEDVALTNIAFSETYTAAIERKQVAQQEFEASKKQAESAVVKAKGEAEAARIINESSKSSPAFIELRRIEAGKEIAHVLAQSNNVIYLPNENLMLNITKSK